MLNCGLPWTGRCTMEGMVIVVLLNFGAVLLLQSAKINGMAVRVCV
jgi:hypothetical protein